MSVEDEVKQVLIDHETSYKSPAKGTDVWMWSCSCNLQKMLTSRDLCVAETREHWANVIAALVPRGQDRSTEGEDQVTIPSDLSIMSYLIREIDCGIRSTPDARHLLGDWFHRQNIPKIRDEAKARMRRLKQITDAISEEFWSLFGSQG